MGGACGFASLPPHPSVMIRGLISQKIGHLHKDNLHLLSAGCEPCGFGAFYGCPLLREQFCPRFVGVENRSPQCLQAPPSLWGLAGWVVTKGPSLRGYPKAEVHLAWPDLPTWCLTQFEVISMFKV